MYIQIGKGIYIRSTEGTGGEPKVQEPGAVAEYM